MAISTPARISPRAHRHLGTRALLAGALGATLLVGISTSAQAMSNSGRTSLPLAGSQPSALAIASSVCSKVSASAVSAIVGYHVPPATSYAINLKATPSNFEITTTGTDCTFGAMTSEAAILKDVTLSIEVLSKPLTMTQMKQLVTKASPTLKYNFSTYPGLGGTAFHFVVTDAGITIQGITVGLSGTRFFGAVVDSKTISTSKIAALAKLAEKL